MFFFGREMVRDVRVMAVDGRTDWADEYPHV